MSKYSFFAKEIKEKDNYSFKNMKVILKEKNIKKGKLKKIVYSVCDEYLKMNVTIFPQVYCVCKKDLCQHIKKILSTEFKLGSFILAYFFLPEVSTSFIDFLKDKEDIFVNRNLSKEEIIELNLKLQKIIFERFSTDECPCCLEPLNKRPMYPHLNKCSECFKYTHALCLDKWLQEKKKNSKDIKKGCMHCRAEIKAY